MTKAHDDLAGAVSRLTAFVERHRRNVVDDIVKGQVVSVPAPDLLRGRGDSASDLYCSDIATVLDAIRDREYSRTTAGQ